VRVALYRGSYKFVLTGTNNNDADGCRCVGGDDNNGSNSSCVSKLKPFCPVGTRTISLSNFMCRLKYI
jgi:hypothetical protein